MSAAVAGFPSVGPVPAIETARLLLRGHRADDYATCQANWTDPEVVRRRVGRFFDQVSHCIVTHGGTVEKFAGDAVMAAFGVPLAHEDDAERAVRAALATLERVRELGLQARIGIESGEVVADDSDSTFATGEAVNLAARLEAAAPASGLALREVPVGQRLSLSKRISHQS